MVELFCTPFVDLIDRMRLEFANRESVFDLPRSKWYLPDSNSPDLSVRFHDKVAGNASGPASGPQTQMAQNLVLAWLAGGRIMELKTVQIDDRLKIGRPCIDATNVGYNIEFSQELLVDQSLNQYVQGAMLIHMLRHAPEVFGNPFGASKLADVAGEPIYDISVGYDLAGIQSDKVRRFLESMKDASSEVQRYRDLIPRRLAALRDLDYPTALGNSVTLSTFHGCPADEIERICDFLLTTVGVHTIVKMNPPMLGKQRLEHWLYDVMGYHQITVNPTAYTSGLLYEESLAMCDRLSHLARSRGLNFGAKFSNTLEVKNHRDFFSPNEKVMYLSGAPLHVITLTLAHQFRTDVGPQMPISFSAGVDRKNFASLVACGMTPITTCTDLLKVGGYGRLPPYFAELITAMNAVGAQTVDDFILDSYGQREAAGGDVRTAGLLNMATVVANAQADPRYYQAKNAGVPRRIDSHLVLFDCITCNKCIPVCPNDANFLYPTPEVDLRYHDLLIDSSGQIQRLEPEKEFRVTQSNQIANFADYCNHCGNCDTFCPEYDGPYLMKPSFFGSRVAFEEGVPHDGFYLEVDSEDPTRQTLHARIDQRSYRLESGGHWHQFVEDEVVIIVDDEGTRCAVPPSNGAPHRVDMGRYHSLVTLLAGITDLKVIHAVNTPLVRRLRRDKPEAEG